MKNYIYLISILAFTLIFYMQNTLAQSENDLIEDLYSNDHLRVSGAAFEIMQEEIIEAIPALTELIETKPPSIQLLFLKTLFVLKDPEIYDKTIALINRADGFANNEYPMDPLEAKVEATSILFSLNDFSTHNFVLDLLDRDRPLPEKNITMFQLLDDIVEELPQYEDQIKNEMINIWDSNESEYYRYYAMDYLVYRYGLEMINRVVGSFNNEEDLPIRLLALEYLFSLHYQNLNTLLKDRLTNDPSHSMRLAIADSLLTGFGEPSDLKAVIDYQPNEPDETARSLMAYSINHFIPPKPDTLDYYDLCTRLITYTDEMFGYDWIHNEETKDYYAQRVTEIYESIQATGEISEACSIIDERILLPLEQDLQEEVITIEGYKFLHYHTLYIKEEIEEEFGPCP